MDQHVAHERAILDKLTGAEEGSPLVATQPLLVPEVVELPPGEAATATEYLEELAVYGFEAEPFGRSSFRIIGVIASLAGRDIAGAFKEALAAAKGVGCFATRYSFPPSKGNLAALAAPTTPSR